ncbi:hypothetical protein [Modestobacter sp. SYSU DS0875]
MDAQPGHPPTWWLDHGGVRMAELRHRENPRAAGAADGGTNPHY